MTRVAGIFDESGIVLDDIGLKRPASTTCSCT